MKILVSLFILAALVLSYNSCDMIDDPDDECGSNFDINTTIYYKEGMNEIDSAYSGYDDGKVHFTFLTPDWVTEEEICSKEHITATYTITVHPNYIDVLDSIEIEGRIIVGYMDYPIHFTRKNTTTFLGVGENIGLDGWGPYAESGIAFIWGDVKISFNSLGDESEDMTKIFMALEKVQLDIPCKRPQGQ